MSVAREVCPSCAAPLEIPPGATKFKCPYCLTPLTVQYNGNDVTVTSALAMTIEKSGDQTQEAIKEGSYVTQTELRRLQVGQDLAMAQMRLSNIQSEIRSIERAPQTPVTRKQLQELQASEADLQRQIATLSDILNPSPPALTAVPRRVRSLSSTSNISNGKIPWLLFSFRGRASRGNYWLGFAILFILFLIIGAIAPSSGSATNGEPSTSPAGCLASLLMLLFLWIGFAVSAKRYHDRGKSAWWVLIIFIPLIGFIWQVVELGFFPGNVGPTTYSLQ